MNPPRSATQAAVSGEGSVTAWFEMSFQDARLVFHAAFNRVIGEYRLWSRRTNSAFAGRALVDASTPMGRAYCSVGPLPQPAQGSSFSTKYPRHHRSSFQGATAFEMPAAIRAGKRASNTSVICWPAEENLARPELS